MDLVRILSSATLFKGIEEQEIGQLLPCVEGRTSDFPRDYTIIDEGQYTEELGIVLSGAAHIVRHDFWGNRSLVANVGVAQSFAEALACVNLPSSLSHHRSANQGTLSQCTQADHYLKRLPFHNV